MTRNETHWAKCLHHKEYYCIDGKLFNITTHKISNSYTYDPMNKGPSVFHNSPQSGEIEGSWPGELDQMDFYGCPLVNSIFKIG